MFQIFFVFFFLQYNVINDKKYNSKDEKQLQQNRIIKYTRTPINCKCSEGVCMCACADVLRATKAIGVFQKLLNVILHRVRFLSIFYFFISPSERIRKCVSPPQNRNSLLLVQPVVHIAFANANDFYNRVNKNRNTSNDILAFSTLLQIPINENLQPPSARHPAIQPLVSATARTIIC